MKPLRLGLKYCGGCNPRYDRVAWVAEFEKAMAGGIELRRYDDPDVDAVLVVTGCESACVDLSPFEGKPVYTVSDDKQMGRLRATEINKSTKIASDSDLSTRRICRFISGICTGKCNAVDRPEDK